MPSNKMRMNCEERLNNSRKLFNLSRKRVENLKNSQNVKRFRNIEKPGDDDWITSGRIGSRDAVLVFRTHILNSRAITSLCTKLSASSIPQTSSSKPHKGNLKDNTSLLDCSTGSSCDSISSLPSTSIPVNNESAFSTTISSKQQYNSPKSNVSSVVLKKSFKENKENEVNYSKLVHNSRKNPICSLSSSDNSISSECDDFHKSDERNSNPIGENISTHNNGKVVEAIFKRACINDLSEENIESREVEEREQLSEDTENCPYKDNMPAIKMKITYKFMQTETKLLRKIFVRHGLSEVEGDENFSILWAGVHMKPDILRNLAPYQRVNHFPRSYELTRKDRLYKNIEKMQHLRGIKHFDIVPQSFVLPLEYRDLVSAHNKHRGPWIVKPAASSRGRGIFIVNSPDQIPQDEQVLVSKYVAEPLCIDGHKCDLRVYVLVTSFDPLIIYIYEEGLVRLATVKYDRKADNLWNPCMHLCNYSINKYHSDYIKSSDAHEEDVGHKWTLSALLRHLKSQGCNIEQLMINIEDLVIKSILASAQSIISACRMFVPSGNNCFELYGFDILIDDTLKPWLLEVNLSPSMGVDSPLDAKVKACLITDLLTCIGIPACSPEMREHYDNKWTRFRNISSTRRATSTDLSSSNSSGTKRSNNISPSNTSSAPLTLEEQRILRNARFQNARRGRFVRIYPTNDTMQRYGTFLDPSTGIPMSTPIAQGQVSYSMILPHNYNQILFNNLYGKDSRNNGTKEENSLNERMNQYERALETDPILFRKKEVEEKCEEEGKRLRKQILKLIDNGSELTQLQARQLFALYLEAILRRLTQEPRDYHEKLILKFLNRVGGTIRAPVFLRNPQNIRVISKSRSAMVAKLLGDFLEQYTRDTEAYVDSFDHFGMIPTSLFSRFLSQAQEGDLESVLALHTNFTGNMPYLYNRCGLSVPTTPPIPSGLHGFLRALPAMVIGGSGARDFNKYDGYYKSNEKEFICLKNEKISDSTISTKKSHSKK